MYVNASQFWRDYAGAMDRLIKRKEELGKEIQKIDEEIKQAERSRTEQMREVMQILKSKHREVEALTFGGQIRV
jgi:prefoldin subunit 5